MSGKMELPAPVAIVLLSSLAILLSEVLSLLFVWSSSGFKRLVADIDRASKELDRLAAAGAAASSTAQKKRERSLETQLTLMTRDFYFWRMRQFVLMGATMSIMFYVLRSFYGGKSVATLPFVPMPPFTKLTQQWLTKPGPRDCSFVFLYVVCSACLKPNLAKLLGTQLPASVSKATDMQNMTSRFARVGMGKLG